LLLISQFEIDGKVEIFLSMFKSDLEAILLHQALKTVNSSSKSKNSEESGKEENKKKGIFSCFKIPSLTHRPKPKSNFLINMEAKHIQFLDEISQATNFESEDQDAYICVLFDLHLYKYPVLAKGVFELLVRLFTRKRTLLENLMKIQMLENPKSVKILEKTKKYYTELRKLKNDAD